MIFNVIHFFRSAPENANYQLVGTKCDLESQRVVTTQQGQVRRNLLVIFMISGLSEYNEDSIY